MSIIIDRARQLYDFRIDGPPDNLLNLGWADRDNDTDFMMSAPEDSRTSGKIHAVWGQSRVQTSSPEAITFNSSFSSQVLSGSHTINNKDDGDIIIGDPTVNSLNNLPSQTNKINGFTTVNYDNHFHLPGFSELLVNNRDIDGNGNNDIIIGDPVSLNKNPNGKVHVVYVQPPLLDSLAFSPSFESKSNSADVLTVNGTSSSFAQFGNSAASRKTDGHDANDIIMGAPSAGGYADKTFQLEATSTNGTINKDGIDDFLLAEPVARYIGNARDANGDGYDDFIVTGPGAGFSVRNARDANGDGFNDFIFAAPGLSTADETAYAVSGQATDKRTPETAIDVFSFDHVASSPGTIGYDPFIDFFLDTARPNGNSIGSEATDDKTVGLSPGDITEYTVDFATFDDIVTDDIKYVLPFADIENLSIENLSFASELPSAVFNLSALSLDPRPDYGTFDDPFTSDLATENYSTSDNLLSPDPVKIDLLYTLELGNRPTNHPLPVDDLSNGDGVDDILYGGLNQWDSQIGIGGNGIIYDGAGNDRIWGDDGDDILRRGAGDGRLAGDSLSGSQEHSTFVLAMGDEINTIVDLELRTDFLELAEGISFGEHSVTQAGEDILIAVDSRTLAILQEANAADSFGL